MVTVKISNPFLFDLEQVEVLIIETNEPGLGRHTTHTKGPSSIILDKNLSLTALSTQPNDPSHRLTHSVARQNIASVIEHGSGRKSLSESLITDSNSHSCNVSLRRQFDNEEGFNTDVKSTEVDGCFPQVR